MAHISPLQSFDKYWLERILQLLLSGLFHWQIQIEDDVDPDDCSRARVNKKYASIDLEQEFLEPDPDDREMHDGVDKLQ